MTKREDREPKITKLEQAALDRIMAMHQRGAHPDPILAQIETERIVRSLSPANKALLKHPEGKLVQLADLPEDIRQDYLRRYTLAELEKGQFVLVRGKKKTRRYVFFMAQRTKDRLDGSRGGRTNEPI